MNGCLRNLRESCPHALQQKVNSPIVTRVFNFIECLIVRVPLLPTPEYTYYLLEISD